MKKIISFWLSVLVVMTCCTAVPASAEELKLPDIRKQGSLLQTIGIIDSIADETEGNREISRAEFAVMAGKILRIESKKEETRYFADVPMSHWAVSYINGLAERKIISFSEDQLFRLNDTITVNEAVKMMICTLGYGRLAENMGDFPAAYSKLARRQDFTISGGNGGLTVYQAYLLLYDTLRSETYDMTAMKGDHVIYRGSGKTMLEEYYSIYEHEGVVTQCAGISIDGRTELGHTNEEGLKIVIIDGKKYSSALDFTEELGRKIRIYYYLENEEAEGKIVCKEDIGNGTDITEIKADDFISFENGVLTYQEKEKTRTLRIPVGAFVVKNGEAVRENTAEALKLKKGSMRVVDTESDGKADVVLVWEHKNIVTDIIHSERFEVYDKVFHGSGVCLDPEIKTVVIEDAGGTPKSFSDIQPGMLLSVYESPAYAKAVIGAAPVSAKLYSIRSAEGRHEAQLGKSETDKKWYTIDADFYDSYLKGKYYVNPDGSEVYTGDISLPVGTTITYCMDVSGRVAYMSGLNLTNWTYGYLVRTAEDGGLSKNAMIKVFTQEGEMKVYSCSEKLKVDGVQREGFEEVYKALTKEEKSADEHEVYGQLIRFKKNGNEEIKEIDTEKFNRELEDRISLHYTGSMEKAVYWYHPQCFNGGVHFYSNSTVKFVVPKHADLDTAEEREFSILSGFADNVQYTFDTYRLDSRGANEDVFVVYGNVETVKGPYLVDSVQKSLDGDGNTVVKAEVYDIESTDRLTITAAEGYEFEFQGADGVEDTADRGDILYVNIDCKGKAESVTVYNDYSRMSEPGYQVPTGWKNVASPRQMDLYTDLLYAQVKAIDDGIYRFAYGADLSDADLEEGRYLDCSWATRSDIAGVLVFSNRGIVKSTPAEIIPATHSGVSSAKSYWFAVRYARLKGAVIYE